jgi:hypothetical protein
MAEDVEVLESPSAADWRSLLGRKVSVRYRLHSDPSHRFSEAIGIVASVTDTTVGIINRRGQVSEVPIDDLIAGKTWR